jgi:hypothetical protein
MSYYDYIDIEKGENLHQTKKVQSEEDRSIVNAPLEAILRKQEDFDFLQVCFNSAANASEISGSAVIEVNNEAVEAVYLSGDTLFINISRFKSNCKYLFLYLYSPGLSGKVKSISFSKNAHGVFRAISVGNFKKWSAYRLGDKITFDSGAPYVEFIKWYPAEWMHRWSMKEGSKVSVRLPELDANVKHYDLVMKIFTFAGHKDVAVLINNTQVASLSLSGPIETIRIPFDAGILLSNAENIVEFRIPGAVSPHSLDQKNFDTRVLGIGLVEIGLFAE